MASEEISVSLSLTGEQPTTGKATLQPRNLPTRLWRAALMGVAIWAAAAVCVFIPIAHFILVPGLFIAGIVFATLKLLDDVTMTSAHGICPRCKVERTFDGMGRYRPGKTVHCSGCGCQIAISS